MPGESSMVKAGDRRRRGAPDGAGELRYALPSDLSGSLRRLDDGQLDRLLGAVLDEARRRGRSIGDDGSGAPAPRAGKAPGPGAAAGGKAKKRTSPVPPGQAKVIRAAFEAGVKPATIARQFRLSRVQVEQVLGTPGRRGRRSLRS